MEKQQNYYLNSYPQQPLDYGVINLTHSSFLAMNPNEFHTHFEPQPIEE